MLPSHAALSDYWPHEVNCQLLLELASGSSSFSRILSSKFTPVTDIGYGGASPRQRQLSVGCDFLGSHHDDSLHVTSDPPSSCCRCRSFSLITSPPPSHTLLFANIHFNMRVLSLAQAAIFLSTVYGQDHGEEASREMGPVAFMWPPDREWGASQDNHAPCGSASGVRNRTEFPLSESRTSLLEQN
jgi:hypothetical protein